METMPYRVVGRKDVPGISEKPSVDGGCLSVFMGWIT